MSAYQIKTNTIVVGDSEYHICSLKDRQEFEDIDGLAELAGISSATWALFGVVWPSSMMLADIMDTQLTGGLRVLEMGCGLGLASLVAAKHGADITASDYHPLAQHFLDNNSFDNQLALIPFACSDWAKPNLLLGKFDLLIGSDLLYEPNHPELLSQFIDFHASPNVTVIIIDPDRRQQKQFSKKMFALGFACVSEKIATPRAIALNYKGKKLTYTRQTSISTV
jgi:predicted nicotinamide N-methyase